MSEQVNHPNHYGGAENPYEAIKVIEAWQLDFCLGNTVKYISRAGKKEGDKTIQDLEKAQWYLNRKINEMKKDQQGSSIFSDVVEAHEYENKILVQKLDLLNEAIRVIRLGRDYVTAQQVSGLSPNNKAQAAEQARELQRLFVQEFQAILEIAHKLKL